VLLPPEPVTSLELASGEEVEVASGALVGPVTIDLEIPADRGSPRGQGYLPQRATGQSYQNEPAATEAPPSQTP
jgi:hypothetical protein